MPTPKSERDSAFWKKQYQQDKARGKTEDFLERQKARRMLDKAGVDRTGKHIDHKKPIKEGGKSTKSNIRLVSPATNMKNKPARGKQQWKK
jgi:hypothetical protein